MGRDDLLVSVESNIAVAQIVRHQEDHIVWLRFRFSSVYKKALLRSQVG